MNVYTEDVLAPDLAEALQFLTALDPAPDAKFGFACFADGRNDWRLATRIYGNLGIAIRLTGSGRGEIEATTPLLTLLQRRSAGVFVTVQRLDGHGATAANVSGIRALIGDADDDAQLTNLRRFIDHSRLEPSILVASGGLTVSGVPKVQAYWRVADLTVDSYVSAQVLLLSRTGTDLAVKDLPRVMRLPGFWHQKRAPRMTRILLVNSRIYERQDMLQRIEAAPQVCQVASTAANRSSGARARGGSTMQPMGGGDRTIRLRELLAQHGGLITPSVRTLLRDATAPTEDAPGNRHATLVAIVARLGQTGWPDPDIRELVLPMISKWNDDDWPADLDRILIWVRQREAAAFSAAPRTTWLGRAIPIADKGAAR